jgi:hypothetical protein
VEIISFGKISYKEKHCPKEVLSIASLIADGSKYAVIPSLTFLW